MRDDRHGRLRHFSRLKYGLNKQLIGGKMSATTIHALRADGLSYIPGETAVVHRCKGGIEYRYGLDWLRDFVSNLISKNHSALCCGECHRAFSVVHVEVDGGTDYTRLVDFFPYVFNEELSQPPSLLERVVDWIRS